MNLQEEFNKEVSKKLQEELSIKNPNAIPRLTKIVVNMGVKDALTDKSNLEKALGVMAQITGQKPKVTSAKKSIATFKLREGDKIGLMVTLRGKRMYSFFEKLIKIVLPRLRDFRGVSVKSFDESGNYSLGFSEDTVFPEIEAGKVDKLQGLELTIVTSAKNRKEGEALLRALGMPFSK